jgi:hypothetical protein
MTAGFFSDLCVSLRSLREPVLAIQYLKVLRKISRQDAKTRKERQDFSAFGFW